jgi:plastocyanin
MIFQLPLRPAASRHDAWVATRYVLTGFAGLAGIAVLWLLPASQVTAATSQVVTVRIDNFTFTPAALTVAPGTKVTWINNDDIPHTIVETKGAFRSKALDTEDTFSFIFSNPGEFTYFCSLHPHMIGTIVVRTKAG